MVGHTQRSDPGHAASPVLYAWASFLAPILWRSPRGALRAAAGAPPQESRRTCELPRWRWRARALGWGLSLSRAPRTFSRWVRRSAAAAPWNVKD